MKQPAIILAAIPLSAALSGVCASAFTGTGTTPCAKDPLSFRPPEIGSLVKAHPLAGVLALCIVIGLFCLILSQLKRIKLPSPRPSTLKRVGLLLCTILLASVVTALLFPNAMNSDASTPGGLGDTYLQAKKTIDAMCGPQMELIRYGKGMDRESGYWNEGRDAYMFTGPCGYGSRAIIVSYNPASHAFDKTTAFEISKQNVIDLATVKIGWLEALHIVMENGGGQYLLEHPGSHVVNVDLSNDGNTVTWRVFLDPNNDAFAQTTVNIDATTGRLMKIEPWCLHI